MKKAVNFNFVTVLVISIVLVAVATIFFIGAWYDQKQLDEYELQGASQSFMTLIEGVGYVFAYILLGLIQVFAVIVAVVGGLLFLLNLAARLVYMPYDGGRLIAYRILMGIEYGIIVILSILCICLLWEYWYVWLPCSGYCLGITVMGCINTYSDRIKA